MGWVDGPMLAFDVESTGVSVESDHILSASLVALQPGRKPQTETIWINPGVPIPAEATKIHGITNEHIQQHGGPVDEGLELACLMLAATLKEPVPIVGMNLTFDLTMLDRNCRRSGVTPLSDRAEIKPVIDVMVLDKQVDRFRKGKGMRKLENICPLYRVPTGNSHSSAADALAAALVAWRIGRLYPPVGELDAYDLHDLQVQWKARQDKDFAAYLKREGKDASDVDGRWPIRLPDQPVQHDDTDQMGLWE